MSVTAVIINLVAAGALGAALLHNPSQAREAIKRAWKMLLSLLPMILVIILLIGLLFGFVSQEQLESFLGEQTGILGVFAAAIAGAVLHIPALLAFPLAASLLEKGAAISVIAGFITTLTMIGMVTLPMEIQHMGKRFALLRNGLSFLAALGISLAIGVIV